MAIPKCPECGVYKGSAISVCPQCDHDPFSLPRHTPTQPLRPPTLTLPKPVALAPMPVQTLVAAFTDAPAQPPASPQQVSVVALVVALAVALLAHALAPAGSGISVGAADLLASVAACAALALHGHRALAVVGACVCGLAVATLALVERGTGAMTALQACFSASALVLALWRGRWRPIAA